MSEVIDTTPVINNIISPMSTKAVRLREYIKANGFAYIDTLQNLDTEQTFKLKYKNYQGYDIFGTSDRNSKNGYDWRIGVHNRFGNNFNFTNTNFNGSHEVVLKNAEFLMDGVKYNFSASAYVKSTETCLLFAYRRNGEPLRNDINEDCLISHFAIDGLIDLHPAELALPYVNHPIGTACMIDLLSGQLYFNQGSGSFTCEGAVLGYWQDKPMVEHYCDVEGTLHRSVQIFADNGERLKLIWEKAKPWTEHRWLKGSSRSLLFRVNVSKSIEIQPKMPLDNGYSIFYAGSHSIWSAGHTGHPYAVTSNGTRYFNDAECFALKYPNPKIVVDIDAQDVTLEGFKGKWYGGSGTYNFYIVDGYKAITIDGHTLTPAILDRPTLAEEDNNGISRKQGEAVFVDEERYRRGLPWCFGNMASSGSFSVSDYLIEGEDYERVSGVVTNGGAYLNTMSNAERLTMTTKTLIISNEGDNAIVTAGMGNVRQVLRSYTWMRLYPSQKGASINGVATLRMDSAQGIFADDTLISAELGTITNIRLLDFQRPECSTAIIGNVTADTFNLIPIRLKKSIETHTSHNGKGGKANEIGFFDTISGKFFGNDGQGEFTEYIP